MDGLATQPGGVLRKDATLFNEIVIDVNKMYFERTANARKQVQPLSRLARL